MIDTPIPVTFISNAIDFQVGDRVRYLGAGIGRVYRVLAFSDSDLVTKLNKA